MADGYHVQPGHHAGLARVVHRHDEPVELLLARLHCHGQATVDRPHAPVQRQLAHGGIAPVHGHLERVDRLQQAQGYRQLERGALLAPVRRGQVHGDRDRRQVVAAVAHGGAHAFGALLHAGIGQPYDGGPGEPRFRRVYLDLHRECVDPVDAHAVDFGEQDSYQLAVVSDQYCSAEATGGGRSALCALSPVHHRLGVSHVDHRLAAAELKRLTWQVSACGLDTSIAMRRMLGKGAWISRRCTAGVPLRFGGYWGTVPHRARLSSIGENRG